MRHVAILTLVVTFSASIASANNNTYLWLSASGTIPPGSPLGEVPLFVPALGATDQEIHVWVQPETEQTLNNISLNLRSTNPGVIQFTSITMHNPLLGNTGPLGGNRDIRRYEFIRDSNTFGAAVFPSADFIQLFQGFSVLNAEVFGVGMGPEIAAFDPLYDATHDAWLLASATYDIIGTGETDLFLQIGSNGITNVDEPSAGLDVIFGDPNDLPLNGHFQTLTDSLTPDGTIRVVPEPQLTVLWAIATFGAALWSLRASVNKGVA